MKHLTTPHLHLKLNIPIEMKLNTWLICCQIYKNKLRNYNYYMYVSFIIISFISWYQLFNTCACDLNIWKVTLLHKKLNNSPSWIPNFIDFLYKIVIRMRNRSSTQHFIFGCECEEGNKTKMFKNNIRTSILK